jgi:hypothetical protein
MERWHRFRNQVLALVAMLSAAAGPVSRSGSAQDAGDDGVWRQAQTLGTVEAYEDYLRRFPLGKYTRQAFHYAVVAAARDQAPDIEIVDAPGGFSTPVATAAPAASVAAGRTAY